MTRLFVALEIPLSTREKIIKLRREIIDDDNYRWESVDKIHLTLKFIGEVEEKYVVQIAESLSFLEQFNSINGEVTGFGFFYRKNLPSILKADIMMDEDIVEIVNLLNTNLNNFGIESDRRSFRPHLTLLRLKKNPGSHFINKFNNYSFEPVKFNSDTIKLYQSKLHRSGSEYSEIKFYHLN